MEYLPTGTWGMAKDSVQRKDGTATTSTTAPCGSSHFKHAAVFSEDKFTRTSLQGMSSVEIPVSNTEPRVRLSNKTHGWTVQHAEPTGTAHLVLQTRLLQKDGTYKLIGLVWKYVLKRWELECFYETLLCLTFTMYQCKNHWNKELKEGDAYLWTLWSHLSTINGSIIRSFWVYFCCRTIFTEGCRALTVITHNLKGDYFYSSLTENTWEKGSHEHLHAHWSPLAETPQASFAAPEVNQDIVNSHSLESHQPECFHPLPQKGRVLTGVSPRFSSSLS